jgi:hypothetical protein
MTAFGVIGPAEILPPAEQNRLYRIDDIRGTAERLCEGESVGALGCPSAFILLDPMKLPQVFTGGLRAEFADAACALVPEYLATLTRRLDGDNEHSREECEYGASPRTAF